MRRDRRGGMRFEASTARSRKDAARALDGGKSGRRDTRELRDDDKAISRGTRGGKRCGCRRTRCARVHRVADWARSRSWVLSGGGWWLHPRDGRGEARPTVDLRFARRVDQAASKRLVDASGDERYARLDP